MRKTPGCSVSVLACSAAAPRLTTKCDRNTRKPRTKRAVLAACSLWNKMVQTYMAMRDQKIRCMPQDIHKQALLVHADHSQTQQWMSY